MLLSLNDHESSVLSFDMVNPFPYAADMRPPKNGYPYFWLGPRTQDGEFMPSPEAVLSAVDFVMIPRLPYQKYQLSTMLKVYGPFLKQNYTILMELPYWELWKRKQHR